MEPESHQKYAVGTSTAKTDEITQPARAGFAPIIDFQQSALPAEPPQAKAPVLTAQESGEKRQRVVVVAFHGMGVHLPTAALQDALVQLGKVVNPDQSAQIDLKTRPYVTDTGQLITEVNFSHGNRDFVVTEAYYSPYFKGKANAWDVILFLIRAGSGSLLEKQNLRRSIFGTVQEYPAAPNTRRNLRIALSVVLGIVGLNLIFVDYITKMWRGEVIPSPMNQVATVGLSLVLVLVGLFGWLVKQSLKNPRLAPVGYRAFIAAMLSIPITAALSLLNNKIGFQIHIPEVWLTGWAILAGVVFMGLSAKIRSFLEDYGGDVVAYVLGYSSSKFFTPRQEVARRIDLVFEKTIKKGCDHLIVIAHSLGTVVSYDGINRYFLDSDNQAKVGKVSYVTYGSPLDKIAYLFRSESGDANDLGNDLIASRQPLINDLEFRKKVKWVNVYAEFDIVAGPLDFFDSKRYPELNIVQVKDTRNAAPIASHTQYSSNDALPEALKIALNWEPSAVNRP
jgi:hypothetical protein